MVRSSGSLRARAEFDFWLSARAGLLALERGLHTLSISCLCKTSAGVLFTLERVYWGSSGSRSSEYLGARAGSSLSVKVLEGGNLRSSGCVLQLCLGARAGPVFVLELKRPILRLSGSYVYQISAVSF